MDSKDVLGALRFDVRLEFVRGEGRVVVGLESLTAVFKNVDAARANKKFTTYMQKLR